MLVKRPTVYFDKVDNKDVTGDENILEEHHQGYLKSKKIIEEEKENIEEIVDVKSYLSRHIIHCFKYHYSLEASTQNSECHPVYIKISKDYKRINIINRIPLDAVEYSLENDPEKIQELRVKAYK